jgi:hypothetical protein
MAKERVADRQVKDRVSEKFEPLVVLDVFSAVLVGICGVRQASSSSCRFLNRCPTDCSSRSRRESESAWLLNAAARLGGEKKSPRRGFESSIVLDEVHSVPDRFDPFGFFIRDRYAEFLFHGHDQFDDVERIGVEIVDEIGIHANGVGVDTQLIDQNVADTFKNAIG